MLHRKVKIVLFFFFLQASTQHRNVVAGSGIDPSGSRLPGLLSPVPLILLVRSIEVPGTQKSNCTP